MKSPDNADRRGRDLPVSAPNGTGHVDRFSRSRFCDHARELVIEALDVSNRRPIATARRTVIVPEMPGGRSDQPLDLGTLEMLLVP
jgi:hypothetical protein